MNTAQNSSDAPLATLLREGTKLAHTQAERAPFIVAFLKGQAPRGAYAAFIERLYHVYSTLEVAFERQRHSPLLKPFYTPELWRAAALRRDLSHFYGPSWDLEDGPTSATLSYVAHLNQLSDDTPLRLVAHSYTRYLGDLSGGQILAKVARKHLELSAEEGLAFYDFPQIADQSSYKDAYRKKLNELPISAAQKQELVQEATLAFEFSTRLSDEVWQEHVEAAARPA